MIYSIEINVPAEDLTTPSGANPRGPMTRTGLRPTLSRVEDVTERDSMSTTHSLGTSVLNKNHTRTGTPSQVYLVVFEDAAFVEFDFWAYLWKGVRVSGGVRRGGERGREGEEKEEGEEGSG